MSELTILPPRDINAPKKQPIRRLLAHLIKRAGKGELFVEAMGKKMRYDEYLALMIWDALTTGTMYFADGTMVKVEDFKDWMDLTKFVAQHLDGPVTINDLTVNNINIYKVYQGINEDLV